MGRYADRVHSDPTVIQRLKQLQLELSGEMEVELTLQDGRILRGTVPERPTLQLFRNEREEEGVNGLLRLDDAEDPTRSQLLWLDQIQHVQRLGSA